MTATTISKAEWGQKKTVKTPKFRVSFPHIFEPHAFKEGQEKKYSLAMLFPKDTDLAPFKAALLAAGQQKWGMDPTKWPELKHKNPFMDGDKKTDLKGYPGNWVLHAKSKEKPGLVGIDKKPILTEERFYAGCYARAIVQAYAFTEFGGGFGFAIQNLLMVADGEKFSGRKSAEEAFKDDFDTEVNNLEIGENPATAGGFDLGF